MNNRFLSMVVFFAFFLAALHSTRDEIDKFFTGGMSFVGWMPTVCLWVAWILYGKVMQRDTDRIYYCYHHEDSAYNRIRVEMAAALCGLVACVFALTETPLARLASYAPLFYVVMALWLLCGLLGFIKWAGEAAYRHGLRKEVDELYQDIIESAKK